MPTTAPMCGDSPMSNQECTPDTVLNRKDLTSLLAESPRLLVDRDLPKVLGNF